MRTGRRQRDYSSMASSGSERLEDEATSTGPGCLEEDGGDVGAMF